MDKFFEKTKREQYFAGVQLKKGVKIVQRKLKY